MRGGGKEAQLPGAESLRGAEKSQQYRKYFLQYSTFASERPPIRTWGRQTCFLHRAPSNEPRYATAWPQLKMIITHNDSCVQGDYQSAGKVICQISFMQKALHVKNHKNVADTFLAF